MGKYQKLLLKILNRTSDGHIGFSELRQLLARLDFNERIKGDHHILSRENILEIINIQPISSKAKADQGKQIRKLIVKYRLGDNNVD